ncbi:MAG: DUF721 domain-containing protein [Rhodobacteraceae bacterium]|nr:DUF721 domain-containing protein [Paracoccaceae bacterium]
MTSKLPHARQTTTHGFQRVDKLLQSRIRQAAADRGFAVARLLTHWAEIAGPDIAVMAYPVDISYRRRGLGATLTVLTVGANAPVLEMQREQLRQKVNAVYGYNAISRIRITQTAVTGFARAHAMLRGAAAPPPVPRNPDPGPRDAAVQECRTVADDDLRAALERLGHNIYQKSRLWRKEPG